MQHDRLTPEIVAVGRTCLLGAHLGELVSGPVDSTSLAGVLDAVASGTETSTVLTVRTRRAPAEAVVSVQPMRSTGSELAALVIVRVPPPTDEQFLDPAVMRHALLDDSFRQIGATLDFDQMARGLINVIVPHFCNAAGMLVLESLITSDELTVHTDGDTPLLRRVAFAADAHGPAWESAFPVGEILRHPAPSPHARCLASGQPVRVGPIGPGTADALTGSVMHGPVSRLLAGASMLVLPLMAGTSTLGVVACVRAAGFREFDAYDTEIGMEFASRAAIFLDNARRYNRERATALTLQRSLLPAGLSAPSSVEVAHRYLPGSELIEVGGDWYESIALPGARAALVAGDVAGHGVRAAVTMGRLRTAIQTLSMLELSPAESLHQLDELMRVIGDREPHFATCIYAIYDAVHGTCEVASAGHPPPLLVTPEGSSHYLDVPPAPPLGVGDGLVRSTTFDIPDGSLLVLYTDGLVENRGSDIDEGLARLQSTFSPGTMSRSVDELCNLALAGAYDEHQRDDVALLVTRLRRIEGGRQFSRELPGERTSAREARTMVSGPLEEWGLDSLLPSTQLLVSELVTNAILYTEGPVTLRLIHENSLVCEVHDTSQALPRLRHAARDDETGRGLQIVSQVSDHWGARRTATGKVVWCEQRPPRHGAAHRSLTVPVL